MRMMAQRVMLASLLAVWLGGATGCGGSSTTDCAPQCSGKTCGSDGCGGSCGTCSGTQVCSASGTCIALSPTAQAVGAYSQVGTTCASGSTWTGYGMFLCPGGKIRGAGTMGSATELICGDYVGSAPVYPNCTDRYGCFPKVTATVKDTLIIGGISDVVNGFVFSMYLIESGANHDLRRGAACTDGSSGDIVLRRIAVDVTDNYCNSAACPQAGGSGGGSGTCGTDCDCGHCWYCDTSGSSNTCRYGGEGPYGCYRGCGG